MYFSLAVFVNMSAKAGKTTLIIYIYICHVKGFPIQRQIEELFIVTVSFCLLPPQYIFFSQIPIVDCSVLFEGIIFWLFCAESAIESQSVNLSQYHQYPSSSIETFSHCHTFVLEKPQNNNWHSYTVLVFQ